MPEFPHAQDGASLCQRATRDATPGHGPWTAAAFRVERVYSDDDDDGDDDDDENYMIHDTLHWRSLVCKIVESSHIIYVYIYNTYLLSSLYLCTSIYTYFYN